MRVLVLSEFFRSIPGPEDAMAGHPLTLVSVVLLQIVVTMWAVWWAAGKVPEAVWGVFGPCHIRNAPPVLIS
jgi:hypothetical protein